MDDQTIPETSRPFPSPDETIECRICRGEGTSDEPLFYPCKCSGSMKFVHQECLMEWLSHSQKKFCELCKTPFRFTKLYHPQMPSRLPTSVFFRRAVIHVFRLLITWCRGVLVTSVWLIILPWCMRVTWRSLFWVADGGWTQDFHAEHVPKETETSPAQPFDVNTLRLAIDAAQSNISSALPNLFMPFSQTLNMSAGEPTAWSLVKRFFFGITPSFPDYSHLSGGNRTDQNATIGAGSGIRSPSLLSDVSFFNWFASPAANRFVIDIFEGQIITLLVVIAFILIFLIREWVVQQQPVINMAAMGAENAAANPIDDAAEARADEEATEEEEDPNAEEPDEDVAAADHHHPHEEHAERVPDAWDAEEDDRDEDNELARQDLENGSGHSSSTESWQRIPDVVNDDRRDSSENSLHGKGKANAIDDYNIEEGSSARAASSHHPDPVDVATGPEPAIVRTENDRSDMQEQDPPAPDPEFDASAPEGQEQLPSAELESTRDPAPQQLSLSERIVEWIWGDVAPAVTQIENEDANDEHVVQNLADEAPFVPFGGNAAREQPNGQAQDAEVAAAAAQAGIDVNDQDAIDDAEDLEGILELIGMQGPITGLFQNAMFSAVLISATLACAVWLPYLWGKVVLLLMGSPISLFVKLPLQFIATFADLVVDLALGLTAGFIYWSVQLMRWATYPLTLGMLSNIANKIGDIVAKPSRSVAESSWDRIGKLLLNITSFQSPSYLRLSINSHAALRTIQNTTSVAFNYTGQTVLEWYGNMTSIKSTEDPLSCVRQMPAAVWQSTSIVMDKLQQAASLVWRSKGYKITLDLGQSIPSAYNAIEQWSASDRLMAILAGYSFFAIAGALYLKRAAPITSSQQGRKVEGIISDVLQQAGGVLKVILIISIEMLAFPLYCGLLLDVALLPLFEDATLWSRYEFALHSPWTAGFVHWFVGTCYMFHFALFVSMCRKIMRSGVLYFIRDPDDPTFHPVRDVLERSVTTQLRKIAFSGLVYGGLVIVCLGGVVWSLDRSFTGILPIHWASHTPSLEFPLDLLFYNFLTPLVIKVYKPSDGLHKMYKWWFKRCARILRLSNFLFGDKMKDEEGHQVRRTWSSWLSGETGDVETPARGEGGQKLAENSGMDVYFLFDGKYVRAPASDQVRIPKGESVFVEVDQFNQRQDGKPEEDGVHARNSDMVTMVYIPPWFRVRIALFILTIWFFAAATGVGTTILPLLFGRYMFSKFLPPSIRMNDIHAFSLGIYTLGGFIHGSSHLHKLLLDFREPLSTPLSTFRTLATTTSNLGLRFLQIGYVYTSLVLLIPILFALLLELYILIPLHAYLGPHEPHVVHLIQDWTLGFLYARLAARLIFSDRNSRPARAFNAVIADGYTNPNARIATRCFIFPVLVLFGLAISVPSLAAWTLNRTIWIGATEAAKSQVWRFSYPAVALVVTCIWVIKEGMSMIGRWRMVVRDEVYLIGERLHNFGEKRPGPAIRRVSARS